MHRPRAPSSPPLNNTHHPSQEQLVHYSSSSSVAPSSARPEGTRDSKAGQPRDNDVPTWKITRDIVRGVTEELYGPHPQTHRSVTA